jgi:hypothetical protein
MAGSAADKTQAASVAKAFARSAALGLHDDRLTGMSIRDRVVPLGNV